MKQEMIGFKEFIKKNELIDKSQCRRQIEYIKYQALGGFQYYKTEIW